MTLRRALPYVAAALVALLVLGVLAAVLGDDDRSPAPSPSSSSSPGATGPATGGCGPMTDVTPEPARHQGGDLDYARRPPNSGAHDPNFLTRVERVYPPDDAPRAETVVHSLEHGYVVVWYDPERADLGALEGALREVEERKVFATPWTRGGLPAPYVVTAWGHEMRCDQVTARALTAFYAEHGGPNGEAPEPTAP